MNIMAWLTARGGDRDGQSRALEQAAAGGGAAVSGQVPDPSPQSDLADAVGAKLLAGWLSNRSQTQVPHTLNFRALSDGQGALLVDLMAAAAQADGTVDRREVEQLGLALDRVGAGEAEKRRMAAAVDEPQHLGRLLAQVLEAGLATHAYAAALLSINRRGRVNRAFMEYLAGRLGLSSEITSALERRYRI